MVDHPSVSPRPLPRGLILVGSGAICFHLFTFVVQALAATSGPWPTPFGSSPALPPPFVQEIGGFTSTYYLEKLRMTHNYHFMANRTALPGVYFEVRLKDGDGKLVNTVRFPDANANFWVRHRQNLLAQGLAEDQPVQARPGERVQAPDQKLETVTIWEPGESDVLTLRQVPEHLIPRERPVSQPSDLSLVLAKAYVRHLCRKHGAVSGELIRHSREAIFPVVVMVPEIPEGTFAELLSNFGEVLK